MKQDQRQDEIVPVLAFGNRENHHLHIGRRKLKSIFAMFLGFCFWQLLRLVLPELETHPLFIYIYAMIEIRESSKKTKENERKREKAYLGDADRHWRRDAVSAFDGSAPEHRAYDVGKGLV